jgi:ribosomal protein S8
MTGYIGEFEYVDDHRAGKIVVELNGRWDPASDLCSCVLWGVDLNVRVNGSWFTG